MTYVRPEIPKIKIRDLLLEHNSILRKMNKNQGLSERDFLRYKNLCTKITELRCLYRIDKWYMDIHDSVSDNAFNTFCAWLKMEGEAKGIDLSDGFVNTSAALVVPFYIFYGFDLSEVVVHPNKWDTSNYVEFHMGEFGILTIYDELDRRDSGWIAECGILVISGQLYDEPVSRIFHIIFEGLGFENNEEFKF